MKTIMVVDCDFETLKTVRRTYAISPDHYQVVEAELKKMEDQNLIFKTEEHVLSEEDEEGEEWKRK